MNKTSSPPDQVTVKALEELLVDIRDEFVSATRQRIDCALATIRDGK